MDDLHAEVLGCLQKGRTLTTMSNSVTNKISLFNKEVTGQSKQLKQSKWQFSNLIKSCMRSDRHNPENKPQDFF
jgi:hypothetical protein